MRSAALLALAASTAAPFAIQGQSRRVGAPRPQLTLGDTLTVSGTPSSISIPLVSGSASIASSSIAITTTWSGISLISAINLYASFASALSALTGGSPVSSIPTSAIYGQVPTGLPTSFTAFTQTAPFGAAGASLQILSTSSLISLGGNRTDTLTLKVDLTSLPQLPAAAYTGTLYLQAQAF